MSSWIQAYRLMRRAVTELRRAIGTHGHASWPSVEGTIEGHDYDDEFERRAGLIYVYKIADEYYTVTAWRKVKSESQADLLYSRYPIAMRVCIRYNPTNPQLSVLDTPDLSDLGV